MNVGRTLVWLAVAGVMLLAAGRAGVQAQTASGKAPQAIIDTKFGSMEIRFFPDKAPKHVENFMKLTKSGFYDKTIFHRVIPGFMIQGGDPHTKDEKTSPNTARVTLATRSKPNSTTFPTCVASSPWPVPRTRTALARSFSLC